MNEQMIRFQKLAREKAAFVYSTALEQGDFETVTLLLAQAEADPILEQMLLELNDAHEADREDEMTTVDETVRQQRNGRSWPRFSLSSSSRRYLLSIGSGLAALVILFFMALIILGLQTGSSFSRTAAGLESPTEPGSPGVIGFTDSDNYQLDGADQYYLHTNSSRDSYALAFTTSAPESLEGLNDNAPTNRINTEQLTVGQPLDRLIIRNGAIELTVEDPRAVRQLIEQRVATMAPEGAFVISSLEHGRDDELPAVTMAVRVPVARFDEVMELVSATAVVGTNPTRTERGQDVTEEYVDLSSRLESMEIARQRLLEIMADAKDTNDLLKIEKQLTEREAEIESIQGRMQYLQQSAALSFIEITLNPYILGQPLETSGWSLSETVREAVESLINSSQSAADFLVYFSIAILPWILLLGLFGWVAFRFGRRYINTGLEDEDLHNVVEEQ